MKQRKAKTADSTTQRTGSDVFTPAKRSEIMSRVRSKNTKPELFVRSLLHAMGYRFRLHRKDLPGSPDVVLPRYRTAVFVHGCFWHQHPGCRKATIPKNNSEFWEAKLKRNHERDLEAQCRLEELGWNVLVLWECEVKKAAATNAEHLCSVLRSELNGETKVARS